MNQQRKSYDIKNQYLTVVDHAVLKEIRPLATGNDLVLYAEPLWPGDCVLALCRQCSNFESCVRRQFHLIHLIILDMFSCPMCTKVVLFPLLPDWITVERGASRKHHPCYIFIKNTDVNT